MSKGEILKMANLIGNQKKFKNPAFTNLNNPFVRPSPFIF